MVEKTEPVIVSWGRQYIGDYSEDEFRGSLIRAFKDNRAGRIFLDSNPQGQRYQAASIAWAIDQGLLYNDQNDNDGQQEVSSFRLTTLGKIIILDRI